MNDFDSETMPTAAPETEVDGQDEKPPARRTEPLGPRQKGQLQRELLEVLDGSDDNNLEGEGAGQESPEGAGDEGEKNWETYLPENHTGSDPRWGPLEALRKNGSDPNGRVSETGVSGDEAGVDEGEEKPGAE